MLRAPHRPSGFSTFLALRRWTPIGCLLLLSACEEAKLTETEAELLVSVVGNVMTADEAPLSGVHVELLGAQADSTNTDDAGSYAFHQVAEGSYTITISRLPDHVTVAEPQTTITIGAESDSARVDFQAAYAPVKIMTASPLPDVFVAMPYSVSLTASGGDEQYTWAVAEGALPSGLTLDPESGEISGTPAAYGSVRFTIEVASGDGQSDSRTYPVTMVLHPTARCREHPDEAIATFEDSYLETEIRARLSIEPQEDLTCGALRTFAWLDVERLPVKSLWGVQNLEELESLLVSYGEVRELTALSGLTNLHTLWMPHNEISSISGLELPNLRSVILISNKLTDITDLSGLPSVTSLDLASNSISDLGPMGALTSLEHLGIGRNSISDVTPLSELPALVSLGLTGNPIEDLSSVGGLTNLKQLDIGGNSQLTDISPLSALTGLTSLFLLGAPNVVDFSPLASLVSLRRLALYGNPGLSDLTPLGDLTALEDLNLRSNSFSDISALARLTSLTELRLYDNPNLSDIQPLVDNPGLGSGDKVWLGATAASCSAVEALRERGVIVDTSSGPPPAIC